jgi:hypothetical protein
MISTMDVPGDGGTPPDDQASGQYSGRRRADAETRRRDRERKRREIAAKREAFARGEVEVAHGTVVAYRTYGCKCPACTEAQRVAQARTMATAWARVRVRRGARLRGCWSAEATAGMCGRWGMRPTGWAARVTPSRRCAGNARAGLGSGSDVGGRAGGHGGSRSQPTVSSLVMR